MSGDTPVRRAVDVLHPGPAAGLRRAAGAWAWWSDGLGLCAHPDGAWAVCASTPLDDIRIEAPHAQIAAGAHRWALSAAGVTALGLGHHAGGLQVRVAQGRWRVTGPWDDPLPEGAEQPSLRPLPGRPALAWIDAPAVYRWRPGGPPRPIGLSPPGPTRIEGGPHGAVLLPSPVALAAAPPEGPLVRLRGEGEPQAFGFADDGLAIDLLTEAGDPVRWCLRGGGLRPADRAGVPVGGGAWWSEGRAEAPGGEALALSRWPVARWGAFVLGPAGQAWGPGGFEIPGLSGDDLLCAADPGVAWLRPGELRVIDPRRAAVVARWAVPRGRALLARARGVELHALGPRGPWAVDLRDGASVPPDLGLLDAAPPEAPPFSEALQGDLWASPDGALLRLLDEPQTRAAGGPPTRR